MKQTTEPLANTYIVQAYNILASSIYNDKKPVLFCEDIGIQEAI